MRIGYGYKRSEADFKSLADKVYIDTGKMRENRKEMIDSGLRKGDVLVLLYLRDLGGSPVADRVWSEKVKSIGVSIDICRPVSKPVRVGRPKKIVMTDEQNSICKKIWLDGTTSERARLQSINAVLGVTADRSAMNRRYGWPSRPKMERDGGR